jgi:RNA polymerase sigma-70 factor (ECF subfamily)
MEAPLDARDATFEEHRGLLFGVAYRMLGSVAAAEDAVQDAYLRFRNAATGAANPRAFLVTVVTRLCLDELKSARSQRERYIGPWLPEPLVRLAGDAPSPEDAVERADSVSMAFLVMLEALGPVERAVFLLREVFDYDYGDIAQAVGKSEAACRQVFRRARERIAERQHRFTATYDQRRDLTNRFLQAANEGNLAGLMEILSADVVAVSDGGGLATSARRPVYGANRVARFAIGIARKEPIAWVELVDVNGQPGFLFLSKSGRVMTAAVLEETDGLISAVYAIRNPQKLRHIGQGGRLPASGQASALSE